MKRIRFLFVLCLFAGIWVLSACIPRSSSTAIVNTQAAPANLNKEVALKSTVAPPIITNTDVLLASATPSVQATTPVDDALKAGSEFEDAKVINVGTLASGRFLVTIQLVNAVDGVYIAEVDNLPFKCEVLNQYPDRLYCNGPLLQGGKEVTLFIYEEGSNEAAFEHTFTVPTVSQSPNQPPNQPSAGTVEAPYP